MLENYISIFILIAYQYVTQFENWSLFWLKIALKFPFLSWLGAGSEALYIYTLYSHNKSLSSDLLPLLVSLWFFLWTWKIIKKNVDKKIFIFLDYSLNILFFLLGKKNKHSLQKNLSKNYFYQIFFWSPWK